MRTLGVILVFLMFTGFVSIGDVFWEGKRWVDFDFTDGSETDSTGSDIEKTTTTADAVTMRRDSNSWVQYAKTFSGDLKCRFQINVASVSAAASSYGAPVILSTQAGTAQDIYDGTNTLIQFAVQYSSGLLFSLYIKESEITGTVDNSTTLSTSTDYYVILERVSNVVKAYIYDDAAYSNLVDTLDTSAESINDTLTFFEYVVSRDSSNGDPTAEVDYTMSNLQFWE